MKNVFPHIPDAFSFKVIIPTVIILLASVGAFAMIKTAPKANKRPPVTMAPTVTTKTFTQGTHRVEVSVMGTVVAAHKIILESRVSGNVQSVSKTFVPGGFFQADEEILRIDQQDYELALSEVRAEVTTAEYDLTVEKGHQNVAGREWDLLKKSAKGTTQEANLALRKPHLEKAKADLAAAKAKLRKAQLDLERTRITAPFAAMIETKSTDLGATINSQEALATLVGTDEFWVQVSVPVDRLGWIKFPTDETLGATASIVSGSNGHISRREGQVTRLLPSLEDEGRMARILVSVKDPLNLQAHPDVKPLLLGSYVNVFVEGNELNNAYSIPREAFRDNGKLWVLNNENTLEIRTVTPVWRNASSVLINEGLAPGERVIVSSISAPMQGMKLRTVTAPTKTAESKEGRTDG